MRLALDAIDLSATAQIATAAPTIDLDKLRRNISRARLLTETPGASIDASIILDGLIDNAPPRTKTGSRFGGALGKPPNQRPAHHGSNWRCGGEAQVSPCESVKRLKRCSDGCKQGRVAMRAIGRFAIAIVLVLGFTAASAQPRQIIILRHGEKTDGPDLCPTGVHRAEALAKQYYLGKRAQRSLFGANEPAAFYFITGHTKKTIEPTAHSWGLKLLSPSTNTLRFPDKEERENQQTRDAAHDVLTNPNFQGKIVVMTWEHKRIANEELDAKFPSEPVTLRRLLKLDLYGTHHMSEEIPKTWSGKNYDYFWIVDYGDPGSPEPTRVTILKQTFTAPYEDVPDNDWNVPEPRLDGCVQ
jgi:hypothetical protein